MIRKINNNISFKAIYPLKTVATARNEDIFRLGPILRMGEQYPENDIFIGVNTKKQMYIEVHKKDKVSELLTEEVLDKCSYSTEELVNLAQIVFDLNAAHKIIHPETFYRTVTQKTISQMSLFDMAKAVNDAVFKFNNRPENRPN